VTPRGWFLFLRGWLLTCSAWGVIFALIASCSHPRVATDATQALELAQSLLAAGCVTAPPGTGLGAEVCANGLRRLMALNAQLGTDLQREQGAVAVWAELQPVLTQLGTGLVQIGLGWLGGRVGAGKTLGMTWIDQHPPTESSYDRLTGMVTL
jgi:hypothetical protein